MRTIITEKVGAHKVTESAFQELASSSTAIDQVQKSPASSEEWDSNSGDIFIMSNDDHCIQCGFSIPQWVGELLGAGTSLVMRLFTAACGYDKYDSHEWKM